MPNVGYINREQYQTPNRAEENLKSFFSNLDKQYKEKRDKDELGDILSEYQKTERTANDLEDAFFKLERSNIPPTKRVEFIKNFGEINKANQIKQKTLNEVGGDFAKKRQNAVGDYVNDSIKMGESAQEQRYAIEQARKAVSGEVQGPGMKAALKNNPYTAMIVGLTPDEAALQAANKKLLEGTKGLFGSRPTEREIFLLLNTMLPSIGKTKEANEAGLEFIEKVNDMKLAKSKIVDEITKGGTVYVADLERKVSEQLQPLADALLTELKEAEKNLKNEKEEPKKDETSKSQLKVKAPDGSLWEMTQEQIDKAKEQGVIFEPVK